MGSLFLHQHLLANNSFGNDGLLNLLGETATKPLFGGISAPMNLSINDVPNSGSDQIANQSSLDLFGQALPKPLFGGISAPMNLSINDMPNFGSNQIANQSSLNLFGQSLPAYIGRDNSRPLNLLKRNRQYSAVHNSFEECLSRIELDSTRIQLAKQHYKAIKSWLESRLNVEVRRVGSFRKHTKIRPLVQDNIASPIDIDARVCFGDATHFAPIGYGVVGDTLLQILQKAVSENKTYRLMKPEIDKPTVTLTYANEFSIELTPCYRNRMPPDNWERVPPSYLLCNSAGAWEVTDYDYDAYYITAMNKLCNGNLIPAIKLIKQFIRNRNIPLKSFQVELVCLKVLVPFFMMVQKNELDWEWQHLIVFFLDAAPAVLREMLSIPGSRTVVPAIADLFKVEKLFSELAGLASTIKEFGDGSEACKFWRILYGAPFPAA